MRTGILCAGIVAACAGWAQSPVFEVASVKVSGPQSVRGSEGGPGSKDPGRYRFHSATMLDLIAVAYNVEYFQVSSKTSVERDRYDVTAIVPAGASKAEFRAMMQNLLAERFHLKVHIVSRDFPAFELVVAKGGAKLTESVEDAAGAVARPAVKDRFPELPAGKPGMTSHYSMVDGVALVRMRAQQMPVSALALRLWSRDDPPIVDQTGLTGKYDFTLEYAMEMAESNAPAAAVPTLGAALVQQLGLQLVSKKTAFDVVTVDSFDKVPTEN